MKTYRTVGDVHIPDRPNGADLRLSTQFSRFRQFKYLGAA